MRFLDRERVRFAGTTAVLGNRTMSPLEVAAFAGKQVLSVKNFCAQFAALGYRVDRSLDCRAPARYMTGPHAGKSYPCCTTGLREADTGRSAFHYQSRRDANFRAMMKLRHEICAIVRGALLEV